jgi:hypothetical protein
MDNRHRIFHQCMPHNVTASGKPKKTILIIRRDVTFSVTKHGEHCLRQNVDDIWLAGLKQTGQTRVQLTRNAHVRHNCRQMWPVSVDTENNKHLSRPCKASHVVFINEAIKYIQAPLLLAALHLHTKAPASSHGYDNALQWLPGAERCCLLRAHMSTARELHAGVHSTLAKCHRTGRKHATSVTSTTVASIVQKASKSKSPKTSFASDSYLSCPKIAWDKILTQKIAHNKPEDGAP